MEQKLSHQERQNLRERHRKERDPRTRDRIKAVLAYDDGYSYSEIARILLLDDETIRRHIQDFQNSNKLSNNHQGSQSKFTSTETNELIQHLSKVTYLYVKDICRYVRQQYQKKYSVSGMTKWLRSHHFVYKKPHAVPAKSSPEKQLSFIKYYNRLKKKAGSKEPIYFADSVHPQHQTQMAYGWILKGIRKSIPTTAYQKRLNFIGGICLNGYRFTYEQVKTVNANTICDFLWTLRKKHPGNFQVHLIWDNAQYHKNDEVKSFAKELGIKIHYLPPYSPNLNPVERIWKMMHEFVRYNQYYEKFSEFTDAIIHFFKTIGRKKRLLQNRITDNFQIFKQVNFAF